MCFLRMFIFVLLVTGMMSCGLVGSNFGGSGFSANNSEETEDTSEGEFRVRSGPLESEDTCIKNKDCVQLCDSMLSQFSDQTKCYEETEEEVQSFRDVYNLLALGVPGKLEKITPGDMEDFLTFSPGLWKDAVYGFERGRKENCTPNDGSTDPTLRENCKFEDYYQQLGYDYEGAASALQWIVENDWLAELVNKYDEDQIILKALFTVLNDPLSAMNRIKAGDTYTKCGEDKKITLPQPPAETFDFNLQDNENVYGILGADCVENTDNYFYLSVQEENDHAIIAGHELLRLLCKKTTCNSTTLSCSQICINNFYSKISDKAAVLCYISENRVINGFSPDTSALTCP